jgi:hypothetical protein
MVATHFAEGVLEERFGLTVPDLSDDSIFEKAAEYKELAHARCV